MLQNLSASLVLAATVTLAAGCGRYHLGTRSLYASDVETVYVPVFESTSYRRELGERLTEAVVKEIEKRTPIKVVNTPSADSVLSGSIIEDRKRVLVENPNDEPRDIEYNLTVRVNWIDRRGEQIRHEMSIPITPNFEQINQPSSFVPEGGQTVATGQMESIEKLAQQIVDRMEMPW